MVIPFKIIAPIGVVEMLVPFASFTVVVIFSAVFNAAEVNTIANKDEKLRGKSKAPTFLLTYRGTYMGLMKNCGFNEPEAKAIEVNYHKMYVVSDQWVETLLQQAAKVGYVTAAFGLRVRTPLMAKCLMGTTYAPYEAEKQGRTAGNALGQSWCLLNSRAAHAFMEKVRAHPVYRTKVRLCILIHDAIYLYWENNWEITKWVNDNLTKEMQWQEDPLIAHETVKLYGELDVFFPSWKDGVTLPMQGSISDIKATILHERQKRIKALNEKANEQ